MSIKPIETQKTDSTTSRMMTSTNFNQQTSPLFEGNSTNENKKSEELENLNRLIAEKKEELKKAQEYSNAKDYKFHQKRDMLVDKSVGYKILLDSGTYAAALGSQPFIWGFIAGSGPVMATGAIMIAGGLLLMGASVLIANCAKDENVKKFYDSKVNTLTKEIEALEANKQLLILS